VKENILTLEQIEKITNAFIKGRDLQGGPSPTPDEIESMLWWFNEVARGAVLMQWVLNGELSINLKDNVIAFIDSGEDTISPLIMQQLESLDADGDNEV